MASQSQTQLECFQSTIGGGAERLDSCPHLGRPWAPGAPAHARARLRTVLRVRITVEEILGIQISH